jgi:acetoin utilization deacetylase AcuC-like enzyme
MFGYFWNAELVHRWVGVTCPEVADRCRVLAPQEVFGSANGIRVGSFESRDDSLLSLAHDAAYIAEVQNAHSWGRRYLDAGDTLVTPDVLEQSLLAASAGCEALDPVARMELTEEDFGRMTEIVLRATRPFTGGRTLSLLEGGDNPCALRDCVAAHCRALAACSA